jgi:hypothetical protein
MTEPAGTVEDAVASQEVLRTALDAVQRIGYQGPVSYTAYMSDKDDSALKITVARTSEVQELKGLLAASVGYMKPPRSEQFRFPEDYRKAFRDYIDHLAAIERALVSGKAPS